MNGPITMYKLKPVVHFSGAVEIAPSMYRMKNIYSSNRNSFTGETKADLQTLPNILEQKPDSDYEKLEQRQKAVLNQLGFLQDQMSILKQEILKKNSEKNPSAEQISSFHQGTAEIKWEGVKEEVVLHASPDCPPYSLLAASRLWPGLRVRVTCHSHSSVAALPPHVHVFSSLASTPAPHIHIRLIWKKMGIDCEMVISPLTHCPIRGEVNVLRYLHRSISAPADPVAETQLDSLLDVCHRLSHAHTLHNKQLAVRSLNTKLSAGEWLGGREMSVADVAAWSVVCATSGVELSQNMTKWKSRCEAAIGQKAA